MEDISAISLLKFAASLNIRIVRQFSTKLYSAPNYKKKKTVDFIPNEYKGLKFRPFLICNLLIFQSYYFGFTIWKSLPVPLYKAALF